LGGGILTILLIGQSINLITGTVGSLLLVGGYHRILFVLSGASLIANAGLCMLLIPIFGITGAAVSNTISIGVMYSIALFAVRTKMKIWPYNFHYFKGVLSIGFAGVCALVVKMLLLDPTPLNLAIQFFVLVLAFSFTLYLTGLSSEDQVFVEVVLRRLGIEKDFFQKDVHDAQN
jgi:O-antigen/teichoic acid export membrane protein